MAEQAPAKQKKTVNGKVFSIILRQDQMARLDRLLEATEMNRNQFFRACVEHLTPADIRKMQDR